LLAEVVSARADATAALADARPEASARSALPTATKALEQVRTALAALQATLEARDPEEASDR
jgi:hypothetical protein